MCKLPAIAAHMKALIDYLGCYDAVAETLNARWGGGASKGTISRKISGTLDWTIADAIALEDATGRFPITRFMAMRLEVGGVCSASLSSQSGAIAKEGGEAVAAILAAAQSSGAEDYGQAIKEIDEAIDALQVTRGAIVERIGGGV